MRSPPYALRGPTHCCRGPGTPRLRRAQGRTARQGPRPRAGGLHAARRTRQPNTTTHLHAVLALAASVEGPAEVCAAHSDAALAGRGRTASPWPRPWPPGRWAVPTWRSAGPVRRRYGWHHWSARSAARPLRRPDARPALLRGGGGALGPYGRGLGRAAGSGRGVRTVDRAHHRPAGSRPAGPLPCPAGAAGGDRRVVRGGAGPPRPGRWRLRAGPHPAAPRAVAAAPAPSPRGPRPLRDALVAFERCSARAWADRAGGELRAAGEAVDVPESGGPGPLAGLTPQQQRIARCVAEGATNREVAVRLSVSPRTVDHHLRNVFAALGVRSGPSSPGCWADRPCQAPGPGCFGEVAGP
ncbi:helix-turn-helix transcriptional regulator [Streptomyces sp. M10(2022)]